MNIHKLVKQSKKLVSDNSPAILTAIGVTGTITTAYLAARASFKASDVIRENKPWDFNGTSPKPEPLTKKEKALLVWKLYIPAVLTGAATCACILGANYIGTKRAVALATAYSLSKEAAEEYQTKVVDKLGKAEEKQLRDELAQERANKLKSQEVVFVVGDSLCHDAFSGRYFMCDKEKIRRAENDINYEILHSDYATLHDFYKIVGLEDTSVSHELGWNAENPLAISYSTVESPDGRPCLSYDFAVVPIRDPWRFQ